MADVTTPLLDRDLFLNITKFSSSILPSDTQQFNLGSGSLEWKDLYATNVFVSGYISGTFSGSMTSAESASYALSASYAISSSHSDVSDFAFSADSASYALSASHSDNSDNSISASYALSSSHSDVSDSTISASYALSSSHSDNSDNSISSSYAITSSYSLTSETSISASYASTASILSNPQTLRGFKTGLSFNTSSYVTGLSVNLSVTKSVYVKISLNGNWPTVGPVGYIGEFFIQKGDGVDSYAQPGTIIQEINHNASGGKVKSQIIDPGLSASPSTFNIQFIVNKENMTNVSLVYDIMGSYNSVV